MDTTELDVIANVLDRNGIGEGIAQQVYSALLRYRLQLLTENLQRRAELGLDIRR